MAEKYDYRKFQVLYVDDEEKSLKAFARAFGDDFRILTATNAQDGFRLLQEHQDEVAILMTDQRMPGEKGTWLLQRAKEVSPATLRFLVTAFTEFNDAVTAINAGGIFHYVTKPWDPNYLEAQLKRAMEFFWLQRENERLLREKMETLRNLLIADRLVSLGMLTAGLSHHIRNALVAVKTFLELAPAMMRDEKAAPDKIRHEEFWTDYHKSVLSQIDKINDLLKALWAAAEKPATQTTEKIHLRQLLAATTEGLQPLIAEKKISIENQIPEDLPVVTAERAKFQRLFDLLLREELASLPDGSQITFTGTTHYENPERPEVQLQIADNGPGLSKEKLRYLFDPFMVRMDDPAEYGIHLMGCFFIVHHHGGRIVADSVDGKGTTFTLHLPTAPARSLPELNTEFAEKSRLAEQIWGAARPKH